MHEKMYIRQASKSVCRGHLKHARRLIVHDDPTGAHMKEEEEDYALRAIFRAPVSSEPSSVDLRLPFT